MSTTTTRRDTVAAGRPATPAPPSTWQSIGLVTEREIASKLRSKVFVISTIILFALALVAIIWGGFAAKSDPTTPVAVTADTASVVEGLNGVTATTTDSADDAIALVRDGKADVAVVPDADPVGPFSYELVAKDAPPDALLQALSVSPHVEILDTGQTNFWLRYFVALGFGVVFLMAASTFGATIAQSVVEEKQTRIVEILISAIPVRALLAGKVIGNTILAMAQIVGFVAIAIVGLTVTGQSSVLTGLGAPLVWFAVFFFFGFVLLASLFAAAGAMVSRQEDVGSTTAPLTLLIMAPYFLVIFFNDNPVVLAVMSYVPFSAPVAMPLRLYLGDAQWWEPLLSLLILVATCVIAIGVASRIYGNAILRMGGRVKLAEALAS